MGVTCLLCGREFDAVTNTHLKSEHGITVADYRKMFPSADLMSEEIKQRIVDSLEGRVVSEETRQKLSESNKGNTSALGFRQTEEAKQRMSESKKGREVSEETRQKLSASLLGRVASEETKRQRSESQKELWRDSEYARMMSEVHKENWKNPEFARRMVEAQNRKPNGPELQLLSVLSKHFPDEWKYVGDGTFWLEGKNPDFMNVNGEKQVIEIFGYYWHDPGYFPSRMSEEELIAHYREYGFNCIVFWEFDVYNEEEVVERMREVFR